MFGRRESRLLGVEHWWLRIQTRIFFVIDDSQLVWFRGSLTRACCAVTSNGVGVPAIWSPSRGQLRCEGTLGEQAFEGIYRRTSLRKVIFSLRPCRSRSALQYSFLPVKYGLKEGYRCLLRNQCIASGDHGSFENSLQVERRPLHKGRS